MDKILPYGILLSTIIFSIFQGIWFMIPIAILVGILFILIELKDKKLKGGEASTDEKHNKIKP